MENLSLETTISDILLAEKKYNKGITSDITNELNSRGISITVRTVQMYMKGTLVPDYNLAKEILSILEIETNEKELLQILEYSKAQKESMKKNEIRKMIDPNLIKYGSSILKKRISIKSESFTFLDGSNLPKSDAIDLILQHIKEDYGDDKNAFNRYICKLIDEDMKN